MKTLSVRLSDDLFAEIEAEARRCHRSKSAVVRERLMSAPQPGEAALDAIADLIGSVDGLPSDLSARTKWHLRSKASFNLRRPARAGRRE
jgi:hypothetical protein